MPASPPLDPTRCPLCGQRNECTLEVEKTTGQKQPTCWCRQATFSADLLARIPDPLRAQACVCAACAAKTLT